MSASEGCPEQVRALFGRLPCVSVATPVFEYTPPTWGSPQIWGDFPLHSLGTTKLSILLPQGRQPILHQAWSRAWGFVANSDPQPVDRIFVHKGHSMLSTGGPQAGPCCPQLLHTPVHCSATRHRLSPHRVKGVTPRRPVGLWGTWVKLGTALGRNTPTLCIGCAELSCVHRNTGLSTGATHRVGGQKMGPDLRKRRYPRFPQPLLLLPLRVSWESASKWGLCTT
jgi:hypothetical protein